MAPRVFVVATPVTDPGLGRLIFEVVLLWTSDELVAEAWRATNTRDGHTNASARFEPGDYSNQVTADLHLRPHGHRYRQMFHLGLRNI